MRDQFQAHDKAVQTMADRIQAPDRLPAREDAGDYVIPERIPDEWNQVGEINLDVKDEAEFLG
jgi:hypothetical protein